MLTPPTSSEQLKAVARLCTAAFVAAVCALLLAPARVLADTNSFYGSYNEDVPVIVPPFHGIEPRLSLHYDSSAPNGPVGVGWALVGFSMIERAAPGGGTPTFTSSDIFMLDGQQLVPCAAGSLSPSCTTGGTHSTKIENYERIYFDGTSWIVTQRDGATVLYSAVFTTPVGGVTQTWKWGINSVMDPYGNYVYYHWSSNAWSTCCWEYPSGISYNNATITLNWEQRSDVERRATGVGFASYYGRIKSIDITVSGARARAYKLTYTTSSGTGRSALAAVQQFGKDATLDSTGTVTGGTSTPAITFTPQFLPRSFTNDTQWALSADSQFHNDQYGRRYPMDVNGDGMMDMVLGPDGSGNWFVLESGGNGASNQGAWITGKYGAWGIDQYSRRYPMDVDGDGKTDMVLGPDAAGKWYVLRSTGTSFQDEGAWISGAYANWGADSTMRRYPMDVNGDGKMDMVLGPDANGAFYVLRSTGGSFHDDGAWLPSSQYGSLFGNDSGHRRFPMDVNGDGLMDLVMGPDSNGKWYVLLSTGTSFRDAGIWANLPTYAFFANDKEQMKYPMDVNGDGKMDMVLGPDNRGEFYALLSTGTSFVDGGVWASNSAYIPWNSDSTHRRYPMDVNGDGKTDLVMGPDGSGNWYVLRSTGSSFVTTDAPWITGAYSNYSNDPDVQRYAMDVTGDGKLDILIGPDGSGNWSVLQSPSGAVDAITTINNGMGGSSTIAYWPSSSYPNTNNPPVVQTVHQISSSDGRGNTSWTSYTYSGGLWDAPDRQFLGFHYAKRSLPCLSNETASTCPYEETWFAQDYGSVSKPQIYRRSEGSGILLTEQDHTYATNGSTLPYQSLETGSWAYVYDGSPNVCNNWPTSPGTGTGCLYGARSYVSHAYDNYDPSVGTWSAGYGNMASEYTYGNYDIAGDEATILYWYVPNPSSFVTNKQAAAAVFNGIGSSGALMSEVLFYYDGASTWDAQPWAGKPTSSLKWLDTTNSFIATNATYDGYGNVSSETDEAGATTSYAVDPTYNQFVTQTTNALDQTSTAAWDPTCGVRTSVSDVNGNTATMTFDKMCRLTYTSDPLGAFEQRQYVNVGNATTGYIEIDTPAADGSGNQWSRAYYDGLGRVYLTSHKGPSSGATISQTTSYNARGQVAQMSSPYSTGEPPQIEIKTYDPMDRLTTLTHADGSFISKSYGICSGWGCVTTTDEGGHKVRDGADAGGRTLWHDEWFGSTVQTRTMTYDIRGNLSSITDGGGNFWYFAFDSLGRKSWSYDPDAGYWNYEYNDAGRLVWQEDAIGQEASFYYDLLGRRTSKTVYDVNSNATVSTWTYDEATAGNSNTGRLTTESNPSATSTFKYDALGRIASTSKTISGTTYTTQLGYDAGSRVLWTKYPDGDTLGTVSQPVKYDGAGRVYSVPGIITSRTYDARGNLLTQVNTNGTTTTRTYSNQRFWLVGIGTTNSSSTTIQKLGYAYDTEGKISQVTSPFAYEGWTYGYDQHRLTTVTNTSSSSLNQTFQYDTLGNMTYNSTMGTYVYPPAGASQPHAATQAGYIPYQYDGNGNMISGDGNTMTWDADYHLINVSGMAFAYDAEGSRVQKVNYPETTTYVSDDYEITGGVVTKYFSFGGIQVARRVGSTTYWIHTDQAGSINVETNSSGVEVQRKGYAASGSMLQTTTSLAESRGYTAQREDEVGIFYLHARYYDPALGRFLSPDPTVPSSASVGLNRYAYAGNDPINHTDTNGLNWLGSFFSSFVQYAFVDPATFLYHVADSAVQSLGAGIESLASKVGGIPVIGSVAVSGLSLDPMTAIPWAIHDFKSWARPAAVSAILVAAAVLTYFSAGIDTPLVMIAADAAIGFAEGFGTAEVEGAGTGGALRAGLIGAAISGGCAALSVAASHFAAEGIQADANAGDPNAIDMGNSGTADQAAQPHAFPNHAAVDGVSVGPGGEGYSITYNDTEHWLNDSGAYGTVPRWISDHVPYTNFGGYVEDGIDQPIVWDQGVGEGLKTSAAWVGHLVFEGIPMTAGTALSSTGGSALVVHDVTDHP